MALATSLFLNVRTGAAAEPAVVPTQSAQREESLEPEPAEPKAPGRATFDIDPIADGAIIGISAGFAVVLDQLKSTGEIRPQQFSRDFDRNNLLAIDRPVVTAKHHGSAGMWSNVGSTAAMAYAILDPVLSGFREQSLQTGLVDFMLYAETLALTQATTNLVKLAVRRPRPAAYRDAEANRDNLDYLNGDTYFRVHRPQHNLDRTRTQFRLVESIEKQESAMQKFADAL
jgi:undecaprenyl-diphosphatase